VVALWSGLAVAAAVVVAHVVVGLSAAPVLSDSMQPAYGRGDLLITRLEPSLGLRAGEIAVFTPPGMTAPVAHRITGVARTPSGSIALSTKGDANPAADSWHAVLYQRQVPVVVTAVPRVGAVVMALDADAGTVRAGVVGVLGCTLTAVATVLVLRRSRPRRSRHHVLTTGSTS
jgi:signal peptidase